MNRKLILVQAVLMGMLIALVASPLVTTGSSAAGISTAQGGSPSAPLVTVGSGFTYQGQLKQGGNPANGQFDLTFKLYDALSGGTQVGSTVTMLNRTVSNGLFTVLLDFGSTPFQGDARWMEIAVRQAGGGTYTTLSPRQALTATPYAKSLVPGAVINGSISSAMISVANTGNGYGVAGYSTGGYGLLGESTNNTGVEGNSTSGLGVSGNSTSGLGVSGYSASASGVSGLSTSSNGVYGQSAGSDGVHGVSTGSSGYGVHGYGFAVGMWGDCLNTNCTGVQGLSNTGYGIAGSTQSGYGVWGYATTGWAGNFVGNVRITGTCTGCLGTYQIDDPLDPANKYLNQAAVASSAMLDLYTGHVTLDANGDAWVDMPSWFQALNEDFDYQLTCIGGYAPVFVAQEIQNNRFQIAGGKPGLKVSWQVTGRRNDPYALEHPLQAETTKPADEQGKYLHPAELGQPESMGIGYDHAQEIAKMESSNKQPDQPTPNKP